MFESIAQSGQFLLGYRTFERFQQALNMNQKRFYSKMLFHYLIFIDTFVYYSNNKSSLSK